MNLIRHRLNLDDTLDVFAVNSVGGIFGRLMIAVLGAGSFTAQAGALVIVGVYTLAVTWILARLTALVLPMRVDAEAEVNGLDLSALGERAYDITSYGCIAKKRRISVFASISCVLPSESRDFRPPGQ